MTIPIPASCSARPTIGGVVAPVINVPLADGGWDFRSRHQATLDRCWHERRCQVCFDPVGLVAVLFGGPNQLASGRFGEPPLCSPCAVYASRACPMVAGKLTHYADRVALSEGTRGSTCPDPACGCGGWRKGDGVDHLGDPAHDWYAVYVRPTGYQATVTKETIPCTDLGCLHERVVTNGAQLCEPPIRVVLVSSPGAGRIWRRLDQTEWPTEACPADRGAAT